MGSRASSLSGFAQVLAQPHCPNHLSKPTPHWRPSCPSMGSLLGQCAAALHLHSASPVPTTYPP